jgi:hypothetical protein
MVVLWALGPHFVIPTGSHLQQLEEKETVLAGARCVDPSGLLPFVCCCQKMPEGVLIGVCAALGGVTDRLTLCWVAHGSWLLLLLLLVLVLLPLLLLCRLPL